MMPMLTTRHRYMYKHPPANSCWGYATIHPPGGGGSAFDCGLFPGRVPAPPAPPPPTPPHGGVIVGVSYAAGVAQSGQSTNPRYHEGEGATLGLTALTAYYNDGGAGVAGVGGAAGEGGPPPGPHGEHTPRSPDKSCSACGPGGGRPAALSPALLN
jgi:hypothetical protein